MKPRDAHGEPIDVKSGETIQLHNLSTLYAPQVTIDQQPPVLTFSDFRKALDHKPVVTARIADLAACKSKLLGVEFTVDKNDPEVKKAAEATKILHDTINKQAEFILTEIQKRSKNSKGENQIKYVYEKQLKKSEITDNNISSANFNYLYDLVSHKDDGTKISEDDITKVYNFSFFDIAVGPGERKYDDLMLEVRSSTRCRTIQSYKEEVTDTILDKLGYSKDELDKAFDSCFTVKDGKTVVDGAKIAEARESFIRDKIGKMPVNDRTEETVVRECKKVDAALRAYTFNTKHGIEPTRETLPHYAITKANFRDIVHSMTDPRATANDLGSDFNKTVDSFNKQTDKKYAAISDYKRGMACLNTLKNIHAKRPWYTRFVDYFRSKGENSTIKNMQKTLAQMEKTLSDAKAPQNQIDAIKADKELVYTDCMDRFFEAKSNNKAVMPNDILKSVNDSLETIDNKYNKDSLVKDTKDKIADALNNDKNLSVDKMPEKSKAVEKEFDLEK